MKTIEKLDYYSLGTNFIAFIVIIAKNTAKDYLKKKKPIIIEDSTVDLKNETTNILDYIIKKTLTKEEYLIFIYHNLLDYSFKSLSKELDIKPQNVVYIYNKAINKLKKELENEKY